MESFLFGYLRTYICVHILSWSQARFIFTMGIIWWPLLKWPFMVAAFWFMPGVGGGAGVPPRTRSCVSFLAPSQHTRRQSLKSDSRPHKGKAQGFGFSLRVTHHTVMVESGFLPQQVCEVYSPPSSTGTVESYLFGGISASTLHLLWTKASSVFLCVYQHSSL